jgi:site-specific recombinase XerD
MMKNMNKSRKEASKIARFYRGWMAESINVKSSSTVKNYKLTMDIYMDFIYEELGYNGNNFLTEKCFSETVISDWLKWLKTHRKCTPQTCNIRLSIIRSFLKYLSRIEKQYKDLYYEAQQIPGRKETKTKVTGMSKNAIKALMDSINTRNKIGCRDFTLISFLYGTAARIDEALSIKVSDLHLSSSEGYVVVIGKGRKARTLVLLPRLIANLKIYIKRFFNGNESTNDYLFFSREKGRDEKMTEEAVNYRLKKYAMLANKECNEVPLGLHSHQLRHARASHWLVDGITLPVISKMLGHEDYMTAARYLDISISQITNALKNLEDENTENTMREEWNEDNLRTIFSLE